MVCAVFVKKELNQQCNLIIFYISISVHINTFKMLHKVTRVKIMVLIINKLCKIKQKKLHKYVTLLEIELTTCPFFFSVPSYPFPGR